MPSETRQCACGQTIGKPRRGPWPKLCDGCNPRRRPRPPKAPCLCCGSCLQGRARRYCSAECRLLVQAEHARDRYQRDVDWAESKRAKQRVRRRSCSDCGIDLGPKTDLQTGPRWCDECRAERLRATNRRKNVKRRGAKVGIHYTLNEIGDRDGWKCHLCRRKVDQTLPGTHARGPTIDHLVPVVEGGLDEPANVAVAHRACNVKRRHKGVAQLRLTG